MENIMRYNKRNNITDYDVTLTTDTRQMSTWSRDNVSLLLTDLYKEHSWKTVTEPEVEGATTLNSGLTDSTVSTVKVTRDDPLSLNPVLLAL